MRFRGWQQLKANQNKGISMAIMMCVAAFFVAFSGAILYTAGLLTAQSNLRLKEERCKQLARSYAEVLDQELTTPEQKSSQVGGGFYAFANQFIEDSRYAFYDTEDKNEAAKYHFFVKETDLTDLDKTTTVEGYGNLRITLAKEQAGEESDDLSNGELHVASGNYDTEIKRLQNHTVRQYILTVEVTAYYEEASYTYQTEYTREEKYELQFTHNENKILWVPGANGGNGSWKLETTEGADYTPDGATSIKYQYLTDRVTYCKFVDNTKNAGGGS